MNIDKQTLTDFKQNWVSHIKLYFYNAWCSGTKLDIEKNPNTKWLLRLTEIDWIEIFCNLIDKDKFENCSITRTISADHTWKEKIRYIYKSEKVKDRCGCWSSFSFGEKKLKIDLEKFKDLKKNFAK